jgi:hypothetical protein
MLRIVTEVLRTVTGALRTVTGDAISATREAARRTRDAPGVSSALRSVFEDGPGGIDERRIDHE